MLPRFFLHYTGKGESNTIVINNASSRCMYLYCAIRRRLLLLLFSGPRRAYGPARVCVCVRAITFK